MICPNCAFPNDPGASVCRKCRKPLAVSAGPSGLDGPSWLDAPASDAPPPEPPPEPVAIDDLPTPREEAQPPADAAPPSMTELVAACLEQAQQKEQQGDYRGAFLTCQALLIDRYENIPPLALASLYGYMARVSELQGLADRAQKYRQKASLLRRQAKTAEPAVPAAAPPAPRQPAVAAPPTPPTAAEPQPPPPPTEPSTPPAPEPQPAVATPEARNPASEPADSEATPAPAPAATSDTVAATAGNQVLVAGFWKRTLSGLVDLALVASVTLGALAISSLLLSGGLSAALGFFGEKLSHLVLGLAVFGFFLLAYQAVFTRHGGQTAGQMLLRLKVVGPDGRSPNWPFTIRRSVGLLLAVLPGLAGLLWIAFDLQRRGWHDYLAHTLVVDVGAMAQWRSGTEEGESR